MFVFEKKTLSISHIEEGGMYTGQIIHANLNEDNTAICLRFLLDDIYTEIVWIVLTTKRNKPNEYGNTLLNDLLTLLNIEKLEAKIKKLAQLEKETVGVLLDISINGEYRNINLLAFYDVETHQTAFEKANNLDATYIEKKLDEMDKKHESN